MAAGIQKTLVTFAIIGLFVASFLAFAFKFESDNQVADGLRNNSILNKTYINLERNLTGMDSSAYDKNTEQDTESATESSGSLVFFSIISAGKTIKGIILGVYSAIVIIPAQILGISSLIVVVLGSLLTFSLILLAWRLYKSGE